MSFSDINLTVQQPSSDTGRIYATWDPDLEERNEMIRVAAYFIAERDGFRGAEQEYWGVAERQISQILSLRESNEELQIIINTALDAMVLIDAHGIINGWSNHAESLFGWSREEAVGRALHETIIPERYRKAHLEGIEQFLTTGDSRILNFRIDVYALHRNGHEFPVELSVVPIKMSGKYEFSAFIRDISERQKSEHALKHYEAIIESSDDAILSKTLDGIIISWNSGAEQIFGYNREEALGRPVTMLIPEQYQHEELMLMEQIRNGDVVRHYETVRRCKDGKLIDISVSLSPLRDRDGIIVGASKIARDITERKRAEKEKDEMRGNQLALLNAIQESTFLMERDGTVLVINEIGARRLSATPEEMMGTIVFDYLPPEVAASRRAVFEMVALTGNPLIYEDDLAGHLYFNAYYPIFDEQGEVTRFAVYAADITERKKTEQELRIAATAFEAQEGMAVTDADGTILRVNHAFTNITGYTAKEVIGKNPRVLQSGRHDAGFYAALWENVNKTGSWNGEIWNRRKNGEIYPEHLSITAVKNADGITTNFVGMFSDITLSKAAADEIKHLAFYDPLTRLPNRRLLMDRLRQALASSKRSGREGALLFIDLDHFKTLNDTLGHSMGDLLLQQVAQRLESCVREGDTVARLGGDEFVVMLEALSEQTIEAAAQTEIIGNKILAALNQPYQLSKHEYRSSPSIGACLFNGHQSSIEELLKQADIAMYQVKNTGRNALRFFDPKMQATIHARVTLEDELRKAVEKHQFHLYYQIQVDGILASGTHRPLGAEALIRWNHPERGLVPPSQFIPLAEETGLILPIGQWVLETACAQLKGWQENVLTRELVLSVNISAKQFHQPDFVAQVQLIIQRHAINPKLLKLELTESLLLDDIEDTIATMNALKEIGIQFSLDDFGTGYSSLQYLKRLPIYQLKIDQSFVRDIALDSSDRAIVNTIIAMAKNLNLNVIAEGVETEDQRQFLLNNGCEHYQGYLFSEPVPIAEFEALLRRMDEK